MIVIPGSAAIKLDTTMRVFNCSIMKYNLDVPGQQEYTELEREREAKLHSHPATSDLKAP